MTSRKKIVGTIRYLALSAVGIFLLWLTFRNQDLNEILLKIKQANIGYILVSVVIGFGSFIIRAYRWNMLIEPLGYKPRLASASYALGIGYFANLAIPRIGEISRCGVLNRTEKIPIEKLFGTVITERFIDLVMLALSMLLLAILEFNLFTGFMREKIIGPIFNSSNEGEQRGLFTGLVVLVLAVIALLMYRYRKSGFIQKVIRLLKGMKTGLLSVLKMKRVTLFAFHTLLMWFLYFLATYVCFYALDATMHLTARQGLFILVAGGLGMSAPVQGGIGAYHYIVSQALLLFGVAIADGIVYATLVHTAQLALIVVTGSVSLIMVMRMTHINSPIAVASLATELPKPTKDQKSNV